MVTLIFLIWLSFWQPHAFPPVRGAALQGPSTDPDLHHEHHGLKMQAVMNNEPCRWAFPSEHCRCTCSSEPHVRTNVKGPGPLSVGGKMGTETVLSL